MNLVITFRFEIISFHYKIFIMLCGMIYQRRYYLSGMMKL